MITHYKKNLVVEAIQFTNEPINASNIVEWSNHKVSHSTNNNIPILIINTPKGKKIANIGDFILKDIKGNVYHHKTNI